MGFDLLIVIDRGGGLGVILALVLLGVSLVSLPLMPLFHYAPNPKLKLVGGRVYGALGPAMIIAGLILIPAVLFVLVAAIVTRYKGTGISQSLGDFVVGSTLWLAAPVVFIARGKLQLGFSRTLAPELWDKKARIARRRRQTD